MVPKIEGSLIEHAPMIVRDIRENGRDILVIPGGGIFADVVREKEISDTAAHFMAIAAMDQYGWLLSTYGLPVTWTPLMSGSPAILLPYHHMMDADPLPHSWDITSDLAVPSMRSARQCLCHSKSLHQSRTWDWPTSLNNALNSSAD